MRRSIVAVVVIASACGGGRREAVAPPSNRPVAEAEPRREPEPNLAAPRGRAPSDAELELVLERAVEMFHEMGAAADQAGKNCGQLGAGLERIMDAHAGVFAAARTWKHDPDVQARIEAWMSTRHDDVMAPMMKVATASQQCMSDPVFAKTMERLAKLGD